MHHSGYYIHIYISNVYFIHLYIANVYFIHLCISDVYFILLFTIMIPCCDVHYDYCVKRCSVRRYSHLFCWGFMLSYR